MMELWKDWYLLERENRNRDGDTPMPAAPEDRPPWDE
jgi:hypothetical protein